VRKADSKARQKVLQKVVWKGEKREREKAEHWALSWVARMG
jgi:hypothetical protein